jgi:hypothetical protein
MGINQRRNHEIMALTWYAAPTIPKAVKAVFNNAEQYAQLCDFCRCMQNLEVKGHVFVVAFCRSCRAKLATCESNRCRAGSPACEGTRFVDAVGDPAPECRGCHEYYRKHPNLRKNEDHVAAELRKKAASYMPKRR